MNTERRKALMAAILVVVVVVAFTVPSASVAVSVLSALRSQKEVFATTSPDGAYDVKITTQVWAPTEWLDPAIMVQMRLIDRRSGHVADAFEIGIIEESDFDKPKAEWEGSTVHVSGLNREHALSVVLRPH